MNVCVVCEYGWIVKGLKSEEEKPGRLALKDASVVRRWTNGKGIGGIAKAANKDEYTLDYIGGVEINTEKILFEIPCEW